MAEYPEIAKLQALRLQHSIEVRSTHERLCNRADFPKVHFSVGQKTFSIFIDDEYEDLKIDNPDLHLCLALRSLENYADAEDFLVWCTQLGLDSTDNEARNHHLELSTTYSEIKKILGTIDSYISDFDFELNAGAAQELRK
ncbi:MAG: hypothetical protein Crog4KO_22420 [Crocinitomicaceae bacterium]